MKSVALVLLAGSLRLWAANPSSGYHSIVAGDAHFCALSLHGSAYCWGDNSMGQLGNGTLQNSSTPQEIPGFHFNTLAAHTATTCGLTDDGTAYCWGRNRYAQLGVEPKPCDSPQGTVICSTKPVAVSGTVKFTAIAPGIENTCGISKFRHVYCWGDGGSGVLGQGDLLGPNQCVDRPCSFAPLEVKAKAGLQFASVAVGGYSTACALTINGEVWCWGDDQYDTFGDGLPQHANVSLPVPLAVGYGPFVHLSIGAFAVCGSTDGHRINCWGGNSSAVLGLGPFKAPESCTTSSTFDCSSRPLPIYATWKAATSPKSLSFENQTACALTPRGEAWCWGSGDDGQLGNGTASAAQATPVQVADAPLFHQIAVSNGSACAITLGGTIYCWGQIVGGNKPVKLPL